MTTIQAKLHNNAYESKLPFPNGNSLEDIQARKDYCADEARLTEEFRQEALEDVGLKGHPKADKAFAMAWERGHANGLHEVFCELQGLAEILLSDYTPKGVGHQLEKGDPHKEVIFKKLRRRFAEYEAALIAKDALSAKNAKQAILDEISV